MSVTSSFANVAARDVSDLVSFDFFDSLEVDVIEVNLDQEQVAFVGVSSGVSEDDVGNEVGITSQDAVLEHGIYFMKQLFIRRDIFSSICLLMIPRDCLKASLHQMKKSRRTLDCKNNNHESDRVQYVIKIGVQP